MDVITLRGIRVSGRHGVESEERERAQPFDVELTLKIDLSGAAQSDELAQTLDYADLHRRICALVSSTSFRLLERLAGEVVREVFRDPRVAHATVEIAKPGILEGATPSVRISRDNPSYRAAFP
jgi:dihydroneopterin aldolase